MRLFTILDLALKVADLTIDVEPQTGRAAEFEDFTARTPIVLGAVTHTVFKFRIAVKLAVADALDTVDRT